MLKKLLERVFPARTSPINADVPVYAIGDVHGRLDLLAPLTERIRAEIGAAEDQDGAVPELVLVGDLVDRGPDSRGVIDHVAAMQGWSDLRVVTLMGNHEAMLLGFLDDPIAHRRWLRFGGLETLSSYEVSLSGPVDDGPVLVRAAEDLRAAMGPHVELLHACEAWHLNGNILFTHAGADPAVPPWGQQEKALLWGAPEFFAKQRSDGLWVVYGHTIVAKAGVERGRIAVDTGAYTTGELTALRVIDDQISFLSEKGTPGPGI